MDIIKTYYRALKWGITNHPEAHLQHHRSFAAAVAQLCCDNPDTPLNRRETYLADLLKLSGGPTCREGAAMWAAYGRGDAIRSKHENMTSFYRDERFKLPGTWSFDEAVAHCEEYCYGAITDLHREVFNTDPCFDDPEEDIAELRQLK